MSWTDEELIDLVNAGLQKLEHDWQDNGALDVVCVVCFVMKYTSSGIMGLTKEGRRPCPGPPMTTSSTK
jgi:hypothetical protein